jgi:CpXC protein
MSFIVSATAACPTCGAPAEVQYPASINADRRPDLRAAILDGSLSNQPCRACGESLSFEPRLTYLDVGQRQWILAEASDARDDWDAIEQQATEVYAAAFGDDAPETARQIGATLVPRLVFGWPALVEKLLCQDFGLDDVALEALKLAAIAQGTVPTIYPALDLRLTGREDQDLVLHWLHPADGTPVERLKVPEAAYVLAKGNASAWAPVMTRLAGQMYVDIGRVLRAHTTEHRSAA